MAGRCFAYAVPVSGWDINYKIYSIELAHLLFAAASEVDVIAKLLCLEEPGPCVVLASVCVIAAPGLMTETTTGSQI